MKKSLFKSILKPSFAGLMLLFVFLFCGACYTASARQVPTPESHFGFTPGEDRQLFNYMDLIDYLKILADVSPMVHLEEAGVSELGQPVYAAFVSSAENISRLDELQDINRQLATNGELSPAERDNLVERGRVFFLFTLSMHSTEVGPSQSAPLITYELITSEDPEIRKILDEAVYMFVPCHNPDGMNMIVENYHNYKYTQYEGASLPGVYHKYVGHNINRDFVTLTQSENQAVARIYSTEWYPQVMVEKHQMGSTGPRYFISPPHDPVAENIQPGIWNWMRVFGSRSLTDMTEAGLTGIAVNYHFDSYWPGATYTALWKGVVSMLSEAASVATATPIYVEPGELSVSGKGLSEYDISINMPAPWPGGWWHLSDIIEYERENTISYLRTAALHRKEILRFRNEHTRREIERGLSEAPHYFIMPAEQHDQSEMVRLVNLLDKHGVTVHTLTAEVHIENRRFSPGDIVISLAQPYRAFIKEVMEAQKFPVRHYTRDGDMIRPYDITSWSLPLHNGVEAVEINTVHSIRPSMLRVVDMPYSITTYPPAEYRAVLFPVSNNESYLAAFRALDMGIEVKRLSAPLNLNGEMYGKGSFYIEYNRRLEQLVDELMVSPVYVTEAVNPPAKELQMPRIALVESWFHDMDAGWTRYIFDNYHIPYTVLRPADIKEAGLQENFDVIILPDQGTSALMGTSVSRYPPPYNEGMKTEGKEELVSFIHHGGVVLSWSRSTNMFLGELSFERDSEKESFSFPVRNIAGNLSGRGFDITGSLLRVKLKKDHPVTLGMPDETGIFHRGNPVFATSLPYFDIDRRVIASFPEDDVLMSGFVRNEELLAKQAAMVWLKKGEGQLLLYSFSPQFRASTGGTYKLLFNGLLLGQEL